MELTQKEVALLFGIILESDVTSEFENSPPGEKDLELYQEIVRKEYGATDSTTDAEYEKINEQLYADIETLTNKVRIELFKMKIENK